MFKRLPLSSVCVVCAFSFSTSSSPSCHLIWLCHLSVLSDFYGFCTIVNIYTQERMKKKTHAEINFVTLLIAIIEPVLLLLWHYNAIVNISQLEIETKQPTKKKMTKLGKACARSGRNAFLPEDTGIRIRKNGRAHS